MDSTLVRIIIGLFLIAHGLVYLLYFVKNPDKKWPFTLEKGWFHNRYGKSAENIGKIIAASAVVLLVLAGLTVLVFPSSETLWQTSLISGASLALLTQILFWHEQLITGVAIDLVLLYGVLVAGWTF